MNFRYTTAAFTISPEPWASLCCANSPGNLALYAVSVRRLIALHSRLDIRFTHSRLRRAFRFAPPSDRTSRFRPCLRLILLLIYQILTGFMYRGTSLPKRTGHPISSRPCRAYTIQCTGPEKPARFSHLLYFE